jgi:hypothetical protein
VSAAQLALRTIGLLLPHVADARIPYLGALSFFALGIVPLGMMWAFILSERTFLPSATFFAGIFAFGVLAYVWIGAAQFMRCAHPNLLQLTSTYRRALTYALVSYVLGTALVLAGLYVCTIQNAPLGLSLLVILLTASASTSLASRRALLFLLATASSLALLFIGFSTDALMLRPTDPLAMRFEFFVMLVCVCVTTVSLWSLARIGPALAGVLLAGVVVLLIYPRALPYFDFNALLSASYGALTQLGVHILTATFSTLALCYMLHWQRGDRLLRSRNRAFFAIAGERTATKRSTLRSATALPFEAVYRKLLARFIVRERMRDQSANPSQTTRSTQPEKTSRAIRLVLGPYYQTASLVSYALAMAGFLVFPFVALNWNTGHFLKSYFVFDLPFYACIFATYYCRAMRHRAGEISLLNLAPSWGTHADTRRALALDTMRLFGVACALMLIVCLVILSLPIAPDPYDRPSLPPSCVFLAAVSLVAATYAAAIRELQRATSTHRWSDSQTLLPVLPEVAIAYVLAGAIRFPLREQASFAVLAFAVLASGCVLFAVFKHRQFVHNPAPLRI